MKFKISYPTDTYIPSQGFGQNPDFYANPIYGGIKGHNGIDSFAQHGYPVYATHDGYAQYEVDPGGGHGVIVTTNKTFDYKDGQAYFKTIYWHLCDGYKEPQFQSPLQGVPGRQVRNGELIGYADSTGASSGDHLHFGLKVMDKNSIGNFYNIEQDNGFLGAIDPSPYFDGSTPAMIHNLEKQISLLTQLIALVKKKLGFK